MFELKGDELETVSAGYSTYDLGYDVAYAIGYTLGGGAGRDLGLWLHKALH